jgi:anthranilate synthase
MPSWSERAKESFRRGDLFEVVPGQTFYERCHTAPSEIFRRLKTINPSPYSFFINLGDKEYLVGASPEMFVRVNGRRIETCPISGTIKRGEDAISDSEQILKLLNSKKDESELTMCSDVDRNDKSRVCEPGSVRVIGRRQIEMYSRLIHTVDHIEGRLRDGMDAFRRLPQPCMGCHRDRCTEAVGDALSSRKTNAARAHGMVAPSA